MKSSGADMDDMWAQRREEDLKVRKVTKSIVLAEALFRVLLSYGSTPIETIEKDRRIAWSCFSKSSDLAGMTLYPDESSKPWR